MKRHLLILAIGAALIAIGNLAVLANVAYNAPASPKR